MIIFTSNINLLPYINKGITFNLSSYYSGYLDVSNLATKTRFISKESNIPMNELVDMPSFDISYANMIFTDAEMYSSFMNIMITSYNGNNAIILVSRDDFRDAIMESLIKLIQQRYGYNCWICEDLTDLNLLKESDYDSMGLVVLNQDRMQFIDSCLKGICFELYPIIFTPDVMSDIFE